MPTFKIRFLPVSCLYGLFSRPSPLAVLALLWLILILVKVVTFDFWQLFGFMVR